ncbi:DUF2254 domain-containing protein [Streptacidiphilus sp. 4-A2]|nr:DUF2254 domain-containing protein [Streptacidiphilus sp. 4-A2]
MGGAGEGDAGGLEESLRRIARLEAAGPPEPRGHHRIRATGPDVLIVLTVFRFTVVVLAAFGILPQLDRRENDRGSPAHRAFRPGRTGRARGATTSADALRGRPGGRVAARSGSRPDAAPDRRGPRVSASRTIEVLGGLSIAILGITSVIFSLLFLVAQWVAGSFSPRLALFRSDPVVWRVFAFMVWLLAFAVSATLTIGSRTTVSLAVPVVAGLGALASLGLVRTLQLRAFRAIQLAHVLTTTAAQGQAALDVFYPRALAATPAAAGQPSPDLPPVRSTVAWPGPTTVIEQVDLRRLVASATRADAVVVLRIPVGATVHSGEPVADVRGGDLAAEEVTGALIAGLERSFHQDPLYAFRLLADIGLRALSPAVNDPATAAEALDSIDGLLRRLVDARLDASAVPDASGAVRVTLRLPGWTDFVSVGLDDLCRAAPGSPLVLARAARLLRDLLAQAPPHRRQALHERLDWVEQQLRERHPAFMRGAEP